MSSSPCRVAVIIVNWNGRTLLPECLDGLRQQSFREFETVVVDNGSTDGSVRFLEARYPWVRLIALSENAGFCKANNLAMAQAKTPYVALLNNDAVANPDWLENLVAALERSPEAGSAASKMVSYWNPTVIDCAGAGYSKAGAGVIRGRGRPASDFSREEWVFGACAGAALYRTDMLREIGLFPEHFFLLYEDLDLSFRAQLRGWRCLFVPDAVVAHKMSSSIVHDSPTSVYYGHRNLEWVWVRNMPSVLLARSFGRHLAYGIGCLAFYLMRGRGGVFLRSKKDALKGMGRAFRARKEIHRRRGIAIGDLWGLFDEETFLPRLKRRMGAL